MVCFRESLLVLRTTAVFRRLHRCLFLFEGDSRAVSENADHTGPSQEVRGKSQCVMRQLLA